MTVDLEKKLVKANKKRIDKELVDSSKLLNVANDILNQKNYEDKRRLFDYGLREAVINAQYVVDKNEHAKERAKLKNERIFSKKDIIDIACKYGLRFLEAEKYKGNLPLDLPQKIKEAENKMEELGLENRKEAFILAPADNFKLEERPKDPLMFVNVGGDLYYLVHKWGNDLSIFRRLLFFPAQSWWNMALSIIILCTPFIYFGIGVFMVIASFSLIASGIITLCDLWNDPRERWSLPDSVNFFRSYRLYRDSKFK